MYGYENRRFIIDVKAKEGVKYNPHHDEIQGKIAIFKLEEVACFNNILGIFYFDVEDYGFYHTSRVKNINIGYDKNNKVKIEMETKNSYYTFVEVNDD